MSALDHEPASETDDELVKNARERGAGRLREMGVDSGGFDEAVTNQAQDNSGIDTTFDKPRGVAVPETMERNARDAELACGDGDAPAKRPASDRTVTGSVAKKPSGSFSSGEDGDHGLWHR